MADLGVLTSDLDAINGVSLPVIASDLYTESNKQLAGVTKLNGVPSSMRVLVLDKYGNKIYSTISNLDGTFLFSNVYLNYDAVTVIAFDNSNTYNATIQVGIEPV